MILILIILLTLDGLYLGSQMSHFKTLYNDIQKSPLSIKPLGGVVTYLFIAFILNYYIISKKKSIQDAFILGICMFGLYDITTYTLLTRYPIYEAIKDTLWGGILFATTTFIFYRITS